MPKPKKKKPIIPRLIIPRKKQYSDKLIIAALEKSKGLLFMASKELGCAPTTIYSRANANPAIRAAIDKERGLILDFSEHRLIEAINRGELTAIFFLLKCLGKERGYVERQEIKAEVKLEVTRGVEELTDDELTIIARGGKLSARTK